MRRLFGGDEPWMDAALCRRVGEPDDWYEADGLSGRGAGRRNNETARVCAICPVRAQCLEYALEHNERYGIWGGMSAYQRKEMRA